MRYTDSGAVLKFCQMCGKRMEIANYYAALPTKYCRECAAEMKLQSTLETMRKKRAAARERRALERKQLSLLKDENAILREEVKRLERIVRGRSDEE